MSYTIAGGIKTSHGSPQSCAVFIQGEADSYLPGSTSAQTSTLPSTTVAKERDSVKDHKTHEKAKKVPQTALVTWLNSRVRILRNVSLKERHINSKMRY